MRDSLTTIGFGILIWAFPFVTGLAILPVIHMHHPLFDTLVVLAMIGATTALSIWFLGLTRFHQGNVAALAGVGLIWAIIAIAIDVPIMIHGPVGMGVHEYMSDIGLMYLGIPMILVGVGWTGRAAAA